MDTNDFINQRRTNPHRHHSFRYGYRDTGIRNQTGEVPQGKAGNDAGVINGENKTYIKLRLNQ